MPEIELEDIPVVIEREEVNEPAEDKSIEKLEAEIIKHEDNDVKPAYVPNLNELIEKLEEEEKDMELEKVEIDINLEKLLPIIILVCFALALLILDAPYILAFLFMAVAMMALGGFIVINPGKAVRFMKNGLWCSMLLNGICIPI